MNDEMHVPVNLPLDSDGFLRRECPTCEQEFKWFHHIEGDPDAELVSQYFCPLCGVVADTDAWWTPEQLEFVSASARPEIEQAINKSVTDALKSIPGMKVASKLSYQQEAPEPLVEPDDMTIVEPPCHPNEPLKLPEMLTERVFCLVCGVKFAV